jgi:hypothetical protein
MYAARLRGRSAIVVLVFARYDVGEGGGGACRKFRRGEQEDPVGRRPARLLMVEIAIGNS